MTDKNKRIKILKEEVINEVTLQDLLGFASKAQIAVMQLTDNCMSFNDPILRQLSARVNKDVADLSDKIRGAIIANSNRTEPAPKEQLDGSGMGMENKSRLESIAEAKVLYKKLKEAFGSEIEEDEEEETPAPEQPVTETPSTEPVQEESIEKEIDLSQPFTEVLSGLSPEQFATFKGNVVNALKASGITDPNFQTIVSEIENTVQVDDFNFAMDSLYDYADANGIEITTESEPEEEEVAETPATTVEAPITESKKKKK